VFRVRGRCIAAQMEAGAVAVAGTWNARRRQRGQAAEEDMCLGRAFVEEILMEEEQGTKGITLLISRLRVSAPCEVAQGCRRQGRAGWPPLQVHSPPPITPPRSCLARFMFFPCELMTFPSCAWWPKHGYPFAVKLFDLLPSRWYFLPDCVSLIFPHLLLDSTHISTAV
jgi:hypothetical protein